MSSRDRSVPSTEPPDGRDWASPGTGGGPSGFTVRPRGDAGPSWRDLARRACPGRMFGIVVKAEIERLLVGTTGVRIRDQASEPVPLSCRVAGWCGQEDSNLHWLPN